MDSPKIFLNDRQKRLFAGKRILVCDDSRLGQILMRKLLQSAGFKIDVANNGAEGVALVARHEYAVVLMDLIMPVMDGLEATRKIHELRPVLPIAALTGTTNVVEMKKCLDAGLEDFLSKPVDPEALFKMLELFLSEAGAK